MKLQSLVYIIGGCVVFAQCTFTPSSTTAMKSSTSPIPSDTDTLRYTQEVHLRNVRQLTFGGENAEAYFSFDGRALVFQSTNPKWGSKCDQIFYFPLDSGNVLRYRPILISTGLGRTTCAYFLPGDSFILYASTHEADAACPPVPERHKGRYVWPIYNSYDIYVADLNGRIVRKLVDHPGYDAEATVSPRGDKIVFTSDRSGDLELWVMDIDGSNLRQITHELGYDGGAFFSPDGEWLVFRASRPKTEAEKKEYLELLSQGLVAPTRMEIFICRVDGSEMRQVTHLGDANWAPFFHPSGKKIIFSSNHHANGGFKFNLFMIDTSGENLQQITFDETFDAFPMFSPDGRKLVFGSNRFNGGGHSTNLFVADWVE